MTKQTDIEQCGASVNPGPGFSYWAIVRPSGRQGNRVQTVVALYRSPRPSSDQALQVELRAKCRGKEHIVGLDVGHVDVGWVVREGLDPNYWAEQQLVPRRKAA
jgi:hypothetical protein